MLYQEHFSPCILPKLLPEIFPLALISQLCLFTSLSSLNNSNGLFGLENETYELNKKNKGVLQWQKTAAAFVALPFEPPSVALFSLPFRLHYSREFIWTSTVFFCVAGYSLDGRQNRLEKDSSPQSFLRQTSTTGKLGLFEVPRKTGRKPRIPLLTFRLRLQSPCHRCKFLLERYFPVVIPSMSQHSSGKGFIHRVGEPDWHLAHPSSAVTAAP